MGVSDSALETFKQAVDTVVARDAPRWGVAFRREGDSLERPIQVDLEHPLSTGHGWDPTAEEVETADTTALERIIAEEGEFADIAQAPECTHEDLVKRIRGMARTFAWRQLEVSTLVGTLYNAGCLTREESEWLSAFTGEERVRSVWRSNLRRELRWE
jgi:hypothetical protein